MLIDFFFFFLEYDFMRLLWLLGATTPGAAAPL
jgi:hypothetical protein